MLEDGKLYIGSSRKQDDTIARGEYLALKYGNRHGLITGATGTGKTVTLQVLAESFSNAGVPVFAADIKGDLSGVAGMGEPKDFLLKRAEVIGFNEYKNEQFPAVFWDVFGESGHPVRATVSEMGPLLLSRLMNLSDAQEGVLNIAFRLADEEGMLLLDLKDLQAMLSEVGERAKELQLRYGNVSKESVGSIQRSLLVLEDQGGNKFFGEPALNIKDIMRTSPDGRGAINILAADKLMMNPRLYGTFLLWLLSELFEVMPEVGDLDKPKLVFFFDEAHLLFNEASKALLERIEQVVRLIRSKGVGIYFITQNPLDIPETVLAQLSNRFQHALRAYSPRETKAVKVAAETFRPNPDFDTYDAIMKLGTGEALVSTLEEKGVPSMVQRTLIRPPSAKLGAITPDERRSIINNSPLFGQYDKTIDRESAFEILQKKLVQEQSKLEQSKEEQSEQEKTEPATDGGWGLPNLGGTSTTKRGAARAGIVETGMKAVVRSVGSSLGRALIRGILGSLTRR
jgi:uncharacterized protein